MKPVVKFDIDNKALLTIRLAIDPDKDGIYFSDTEHVIGLNEHQIVEVYVKDRKK